MADRGPSGTGHDTAADDSMMQSKYQRSGEGVLEPVGVEPALSRVTEAAPARSYMLFDRASGNAVDGYDDVTVARAALRQAVEDNPDEAETLVLIGFDAAGMPVGDSVTFADLPSVAVPGPASEPQNVTEGMPPDLVRALRDPTIHLPQDDDYKLADGRSLWDHLQEWRNAPSDTASAAPGPASVSPAARVRVPEGAARPSAPGEGPPADPVVSPAGTPAATCPGCGRPVSECRAEDEDESYPAVSPADTIRRVFNEIPHGLSLEEEAEGRAALDALLAVGERDRRQIARLTEAVEDLRGNLYLWGMDELTTEETLLAIEARLAVLAGEEDSANG